MSAVLDVRRLVGGRQCKSEHQQEAAAWILFAYGLLDGPPRVLVVIADEWIAMSFLEHQVELIKAAADQGGQLRERQGASEVDDTRSRLLGTTASLDRLEGVTFQTLRENDAHARARLRHHTDNPSAGQLATVRTWEPLDARGNDGSCQRHDPLLM